MWQNLRIMPVEAITTAICAALSAGVASGATEAGKKAISDLMAAHNKRKAAELRGTRLETGLVASLLV